MEAVKCDACEEHRRPEGGPPATFDSEQTPWRTVGIDIKDFNDGTEKHKFLLMVDEATRFIRVALLFSQPLADQGMQLRPRSGEHSDHPGKKSSDSQRSFDTTRKAL